MWPLFLLIIFIKYCTFASKDAIIFHPDATLYEGSSCTYRNQPGVCTIIQNCPRAYLNISRDKKPIQVCGYNKTNPIVCCVKDPSDALPLYILGTFNTTDDNNNTHSGNPNLTDNDIRSPIKPTGNRTTVNDVAINKCLDFQQGLCQSTQPSLPKLMKRAASNESTEFFVTVVGGEKTLPKEFKGAAAVGCELTINNFKWFCGGSIISDNMLLTAAHCLFDVEGGVATWVRVGDLNLSKDDDDASPKNYRIVDRIKHPEYNKTSLYHDIALLRIEGTVEFNEYVMPVCLETIHNNYDRAHAIGWGKTDWTDEEGSSDLLKVELSIVTHENCSESYNNDPNLVNGIVKNWQICAGDEGKDTCQGDSGGPLILIENSCIHKVIGVTSFGKFCGSAIPAIYTRVSNYIRWIENITWPTETN